jgi:hypothetical protein
LKKKEGCTISRTLLQFEYGFSKKGKEEKEKIFDTERSAALHRVY